MTRIINLYRNAYSGLSRDSWMLAFIMFVNRCGSMVIPFMSVYLTRSLHFSLKETGIILGLFGVGSMTGSLLGGWLADKAGHFRVQFLSLVLGGICFLALSFLKTFVLLAIGILVTSIIYECLRPANAISVTHYAKPDQVTRSFSLNRMAVNLGFGIGPMIAGILATISYQWLFIADGFTCILSGILFYRYFSDRRGTAPGKKKTEDTPRKRTYLWHDITFIVFIMLVSLFAIVFFQLLNTIPLYYKDVYHLPDQTVGLLLGFNGFVVFIFEMVIVYLASERVPLWKLIVGGTLVCGFSFVLLNLFSGMAVLIIAMLLLSLSEIMAMPFMSTYTTQRSGDHNRGTYMGFYTMAYSIAFVLAPYLGTMMVAGWGYTALWWAAGITSLCTAAGFYILLKQQYQNN